LEREFTLMGTSRHLAPHPHARRPRARGDLGERLTACAVPAGFRRAVAAAGTGLVEPLEARRLLAADLAVTKVDNADPVAAGSNLTYTITVSQNGPADAPNARLTDTLPQNTTFVSFAAPAGWTTTAPAAGATGSVTATRATLAVGTAPQAFTLVVRVDPATVTRTTLSNTATVTSDTTDPVPDNNSATETTQVINSGTITGTKFDDLNGNGTRDAGEPGRAGVSITGDRGADGTVDVTTVTDPNGNYSFTDVALGTYRVREVAPAGTTQTTTNPADVTLTPGLTVGNVNFGNFTLITISGQKFNDLNGDGVRDAGEPGLAGVTLNLDRGANGTVDATTTSDAAGNFQFANLGPGTYRVREVVPAGSVQTTANPADVVATSGSNVTMAFGNFSRVTIGGRKFLDDGNGVRDSLEPGIPGVTINLDRDADGTVDASAVTDADGDYAFANLGPGVYRVREVVPAGSVQTTVNPADVFATSGTDVRNVDFGNAPTIAISDATLTEGDAGIKAFTFTVTRGNGLGVTAVDFATADGVALAGGDYNAVAASVAFRPGETVKTVTVDVKGDAEVEADEDFFVNLTNPVNGVIVDGTGRGLVLNDDTTPPTLSISDEAVTEGNSGTKTLTFRVTLSASRDQPVTVQYATRSNTAARNVDFVAKSGTLTFAPYQRTALVTVQVKGDTTVEADETFFVDLSNPTNATLADPVGRGTILNDDGTPRLAISDAGVVEGNAGTRTMLFTVTLSHPRSTGVTVKYATSNGTATVAGLDYVAKSGTVTFAAGQTKATIAITIRGDAFKEADESFSVTLNTPVGATLVDSIGRGTIFNDD
jgi:uncharacterized repeat protein (TIGR01451 family)